MVVPLRSLVMRSADFSTVKWPDSVGLARSNSAARSPALMAPLRSNLRILRLTGWANASKTSLIDLRSCR